MIWTKQPNEQKTRKTLDNFFKLESSMIIVSTDLWISCHSANPWQTICHVCSQRQKLSWTVIWNSMQLLHYYYPSNVIMQLPYIYSLCVQVFYCILKIAFSFFASVDKKRSSHVLNFCFLQNNLPWKSCACFSYMMYTANTTKYAVRDQVEDVDDQGKRIICMRLHSWNRSHDKQKQRVNRLW